MPESGTGTFLAVGVAPFQCIEVVKSGALPASPFEDPVDEISECCCGAVSDDGDSEGLRGEAVYGDHHTDGFVQNWVDRVSGCQKTVLERTPKPLKRFGD
jgi:hypothetical protein